MKKYIYIIIGLIILTGITYLLPNSKDQTTNKNISSDYKNSTYTIDGEKVTLVNGIAEISSAPDSASKTTVKYFGNEVLKDLDGDGQTDAAFLITKETSGSGTFFYVVGALQKKDANNNTYYVGSEAVLLGDRIAPQTTESGPGKSVVVNYMVRSADEPMTTQPSIGKTIRLILDSKTMQFGEIANNFEGEANPDVMSLGMKTWIWQNAVYNDGKTITPKDANAFTITFTNDSTFSATTDCNNASGKYISKDGKISFKDTAVTLKYCADSQESAFMSLLNESESYLFTSKGELVLNLAKDSGTVVFK